jgi:hypothetical protein
MQIPGLLGVCNNRLAKGRGRFGRWCENSRAQRGGHDGPRLIRLLTLGGFAVSQQPAAAGYQRAQQKGRKKTRHKKEGPSKGHFPHSFRGGTLARVFRISAYSLMILQIIRIFQSIVKRNVGFSRDFSALSFLRSNMI